ncbi:MAG: response regulator [Planctomycetaceae bacterium]|nr:response regulator [Planctomycetaceae bacterium]
MIRDTVGRPMEILLVEDNWDDARLAYEFLKEGNIPHRLTWLWDGDEALEFLHRRGKYARVPHPDIILLDLGLPRVDGRDVLKDLKGDGELSEIPVVVMTASKDHEDMLKSEQLQVDGYMEKPVDLEKFLGLVRDLKRFWHADLILPAVE